MGYQFIDTQELDGVLVITMDDPPTRNAIGDEMAGEVNQEFDRLEASSDLRAVVLTGRDPSFCSGANVKRMDDANRARADDPPLPSDQAAWDVLKAEWKKLAEAEPSGSEEIDGVRFVPLQAAQASEALHSRCQRIRDGSGNGDRALLRHSYRLRYCPHVGNIHPARAHTCRRILLAAPPHDRTGKYDAASVHGEGYGG